MDVPGPMAALAARPPLVAKLGVALCAAVFLAYGFWALADFSSQAGPSAPQAASAADGPLTASGEVGRIFLEQPGDVTVLYLRGADGLEFRFEGDLSRAYAPGDFVRVEGNKTGGVVHAQAVRRALAPWAAAAPPLAVGGVLAGLVAADLLAAGTARIAAPLGARLARRRSARSAAKDAREEAAAVQER